MKNRFENARCANCAMKYHGCNGTSSLAYFKCEAFVDEHNPDNADDIKDAIEIIQERKGYPKKSH